MLILIAAITIAYMCVSNFLDRQAFNTMSHVVGEISGAAFKDLPHGQTEKSTSCGRRSAKYSAGELACSVSVSYFSQTKGPEILEKASVNMEKTGWEIIRPSSDSLSQFNEKGTTLYYYIKDTGVKDASCTMFVQKNEPAPNSELSITCSKATKRAYQ
jgi:hypothetical protein